MKDFDPESYARGIRALNEREQAAIARRAVVSGGVVLFAAEGGP